MKKSERNISQFIFAFTNFSNFCENKIDNGWLAEIEDPKKLKELSANITAIVNWCYNKSEVCLCQNGRRKM